MRAFYSLLGLVVLAVVPTPARADDRPAIGITMDSGTDGSSFGVLVAGVHAGSPAAQMGLQPGDRIVGVNGQIVRHYDDVMRLVAGQTPGSTIKLDVMRGSWRSTLVGRVGVHSQAFAGGLQAASAAPAVVAPRYQTSQPTYMVAPSVPYQPYPSRVYPQNPPSQRIPWPQHDELMNSLYNSNF